MDISKLKIDVKELVVGEMYPSFDDGVIAPEKLCFIKIKKVTSNGYIVDVMWGGELIASDVNMVYINKYSLKTTELYGGIITNNICQNIQKEIFDKGYRIKEGEVVMPIKY